MAIINTLKNRLKIMRTELIEKVVSADFESALTYELSKLPYTKHLDDGQYNDGQRNYGYPLGLIQPTQQIVVQQKRQLNGQTKPLRNLTKDSQWLKLMTKFNRR
jgi:hypothetical protein